MFPITGFRIHERNIVYFSLETFSERNKEITEVRYGMNCVLLYTTRFEINLKLFINCLQSLFRTTSWAVYSFACLETNKNRSKCDEVHENGDCYFCYYYKVLFWLEFNGSSKLDSECHLQCSQFTDELKKWPRRRLHSVSWPRWQQPIYLFEGG